MLILFSDWSQRDLAAELRQGAAGNHGNPTTVVEKILMEKQCVPEPERLSPDEWLCLIRLMDHVIPLLGSMREPGAAVSRTASNDLESTLNEEG
ncbi:MAG: hypothetical protein ETSY2_37975 [Candidatus Entotheonella gemina]|uniref:Uncharacterized protein n=1 Tax=Candidatus Entotheonella gemina TaxID=1429439 RepID=W4LU92_9BACT|nr:MAG: hypothetical protein ETSY2_37975 [Candidatus Entotheonella gemina]